MREFRVLLSCPSDVTRERGIIENAIEAFNRLHANEEVRYVPVHMGQVASEFGSAPQVILNDKFSSTEIYIGLMGARFGSKTDEYDSGTEEEFELAVTRKQEKKNHHVAFLFKNVDTPLKDLGQDLLAQYMQVLQFKERISPLGIYQSFNTDVELVTQTQLILKQHASQISNEIAQSEYQYELLAEVPNESVFKIDEKFFKDFLNYVGAEITNNQKASLQLSDVYVPLDFVEKTAIEVQDNKEVVILNAANLELGKNLKSDKLIILGDEQAGKTTFCKQAYLEYHKQGNVPIIINGVAIKSASIEDLLKKIYQAFAEQYKFDALDRYKALPISRKILFIDDVGESVLNPRSLINLIDHLQEHFSSIVITSDQNSLFHLKVSAPNEFDSLSLFKIFEIEDMGYKLRDQLIQNWVRAGREDTITDEELYSSTEITRKTVDTILGTNFVPRKPFIVLVLLQAIQGGTATNLTHSSFVRYYRYLIDSTLLNGVPQNKVELYYAFLPALAHAMYLNELDAINENDYNELCKKFSDQKGIHLRDLTDIKSSLLFLEILMNKDGVYEFKHSYSLFYFLGQYFHENIHREDVRDQISNICSQLNLKRNANIIIFTSYHSNDPLILNNITRIVDGLFVGTEVFDFDVSASSALNRLVTKSPKILVDNRASKQRENLLSKRDETERKHLRNINQDIAKEELDAMDYIAHANLAYRSAEILGQLLKNHHVRFDAKPKQDLYKKAVAVGLRCLNVLMEDLAKDTDTLSGVISDNLTKLDKVKDNEKARKIAQKAIFRFSYSIIFGFVKTLTNFTGSESLSRTYDDVLVECQGTIYRVLDLSIRLDYFDDFPMEELKALAEECKDNHLALSIIRCLVRHRLYMRPLDDVREKQKICSSVGITLQEQLLIEKKSA